MRARPTNDPCLLEVEDLRGAHVGPLSLQLAAGECVVLQGSSGAGKTLLLRALADMDPAEGEVRLAGTPRSEIAAPGWRRQVALVPAESHWWAETVRAHFGVDVVGELSDVGFGPDVLQWPVSRLSSGERQRLAILRTLANRPRVLLMDEPTANLDSENTRRVESLIEAYRQDNQAGVLWVSHDARQAARVAHRAIRLEAGRIVSEAAA